MVNLPAGQSLVWCEQGKAEIYSGVAEAAQRSCWVRPTGLFIGLTSVIMDLAARVAFVGEVVIKGLANLFGSPFYENCHFFDGIKMLAISVPYALVVLAITPVTASIGLVITTVAVLVAPKAYAECQAALHREGGCFGRELQ